MLRAVLDGEREVIAQGEAARSALARANYVFQTNGVDAEGLVNIVVSPRRKERVLVSGMMFLQRDGGLDRYAGRCVNFELVSPPHSGPRRAERAKEILPTSQGILIGISRASPWLVRLEGRLAKSPSLWVKHVDIVRSYERINGAIVPVALESTAQLRMLGAATLRMTYTYFEVDGHRIGLPPSPVGPIPPKRISGSD